jgi:hypothetical protein
MSRKESSDSHDACVLAIFRQLKKDKWEVKADLEGWDKPSQQGTTVPDIEAKKPGCLTRICEVATQEMFNGDKERYIDLQNYCDEYDFRFYIVRDSKHV